jgi:hypothetical protein
LKPKDQRIHEQLARSLSDSREWIARAAASALKRMRPSNPSVLAVILEIDPSFKIDWL